MSRDTGPTGNHASGHYVTRGVWTLPCLSRRGHPLLVAIDARGRRIAEEELTPDRNPWQVRRDLVAILDRVDPAPAPAPGLRLVVGTPEGQPLRRPDGRRRRRPPTLLR